MLSMYALDVTRLSIIPDMLDRVGRQAADVAAWASRMVNGKKTLPRQG